jgi:23S rRNA pseudouridine955/2504/2580 synthase
MSRVRSIEVLAEEEGLRLDRWFKRRYPDLPHSRLQKLLRGGQIRIDGGRAKTDNRLSAGQTIRIPPLESRIQTGPKHPTPPSSADMREVVDWIIHKDDHIIALNKPPGLAVQGGSKTHRHLDAMLDAFRFGSKERPRLVHRLDKDTSGVLLLARSAKTAASLTRAFQSKHARKLYWAIVTGVPKPARGRIDLPLAKAAGRYGERMAVDAEEGKSAVTYYRIIEKVGRRAAWVAFEPETGRTHQLRVHSRFLGTPILGDGKYGGKDAFLEGEGLSKKLHLHARAIQIPHPGGGTFEAVAPLPKHMSETWRLFGFDERDPLAGFDDTNEI